MFIILLILTLILSLVVSFAVVRVFSGPLAAVLMRIIADDIGSVWLKYLKFAIYVVGISGGVRINSLEKYIAGSRGADSDSVILNVDRWFLEIYQTVIGTLQGIAWMLLVFFIFALIAYVIVRFVEPRK